MTSNTGGNGPKPPKPTKANRRSAADLLTLVTLDGIPTRHGGTKKVIDSILKDEDIQPQDYEPAMGRSPSTLTAKQESFAQHVAQGMTLSAAYRASYACQGMTDASVWQLASRLASQVKVQSRVKALDNGLKPKALHDPGEVKAEIVAGLRAMASDPTAKPEHRLKAWELLGKWGEVSLFSETSTLRVEQVAPAEAIEALKERIAKLKAG